MNIESFYKSDLTNSDICLDGNSKKTLICRKSIAILLGCGFSKPMGYPSVKDINERLPELDYSKYNLDNANNLIGPYPEIPKNNKLYNLNQRYFNILKGLIEKYKKAYTDFDYELFYDFINPQENKDKKKYHQILNELKENPNVNTEDLSSIISLIYEQLIIDILKDKDKKQYYGDTYRSNGIEKYNNFLEFLSQESDNYIVNVHTLNHDLLFESFNNTEHTNGKISDGFDEFGSKFYGNLVVGNHQYNCHLERYTGKYNNAPIRLFKLHGSLDYVPFYEIDHYWMKPKECIKIKYGIGAGDIIKEDKSRYKRLPGKNHANFLMGTTFKIQHYDAPWFYKKIFKKFKANLKKAEKLIIIGYGCKDEEINKMIMENFDWKNKQSFIIDKEPNETIQNFGKSINAKIEKTEIEKINKNLLSSNF